MALSSRDIARAAALAIGLPTALHMADRIAAGITAAQAGLLP